MMAPDDLMVYTATAMVPVVTGLVCVPALRAVHQKSISVLTSCIAFILAVAAGMYLSFAIVSRFSNLLHGDGALAIVAAPVTGAILTVPIALIFVTALVVITSRRRSDGNGSV